MTERVNAQNFCQRCAKILSIIQGIRIAYRKAVASPIGYCDVKHAIIGIALFGIGIKGQLPHVVI